MALNNIFREPRRELIEQFVGIAVVGPLAYVSYLIANYWEDYAGVDKYGDHNLPFVPAFLLALLMVFGGGAIVLYAVHSIGENICGALATGGIELRPKDRR